MLHIVDIAVANEGRDPVDDFRTVDQELETYSADLHGRERWLVLNKIDMLPADERQATVDAIVAAIGWQGPAHAISALSGEGCEALMYKVQDRLNQMAVPVEPAEEVPLPEAGKAANDDG